MLQQSHNRPRYRLRDLTPREQRRYGARGYVAWEQYPARFIDKDGTQGKFWTRAELDRTDDRRRVAGVGA